MKYSFVATLASFLFAFNIIACDSSSSASNEEDVFLSSSKEKEISSSSQNEFSISSKKDETSPSVSKDGNSTIGENSSVSKGEDIFISSNNIESSANNENEISNSSNNIESSASNENEIEFSDSNTYIISSSANEKNPSVIDTARLIDIAKSIADSIIFDTIIDSRDGNVYKTLSFMGQTWFAENLKFHGDDYPEEYLCYNDDTLNCQKYGRLYQQRLALSACPEGWRLSAEYDWDVLKSNLKSVFGETAPVTKIIKSKDEWNGFDLIGFNVLPAGRFHSDKFYALNIEANFWTSNRVYDFEYQLNQEDAYEVYFEYNREMYIDHDNARRYYFSVRCVKKDVAPTIDAAEDNPEQTLD